METLALKAIGALLAVLLVAQMLAR
jgi:hypothetical protein